ncbi:MAG: SH3 domain-containing protein [Acidocella sp.]|nr:SH3 domain-containing protein [Acidocella sp.]
MKTPSLGLLIALGLPSLAIAAPAAKSSVHKSHVFHNLRHHVVRPLKHPHALAAAPVTTTILAASVLSAQPAVTDKGSQSGLQLPRFASLRADRVSFRVGPGTQYPVEWIYQRRHLPVEIVREFEVWRLVAEPDGTRGWVHEAMLTGHRGFLVTGDAPVTMRAGATDTAAPVAILKPGVVGTLLRCPSGDWCAVSVPGYAGWLPRTALWGTLPNEIVGN